MKFHAQRSHPTYLPDGSAGKFTTNGLTPKRGAPYADPCVTDDGQPTGNPRLYQSANFQLPDIKFNKAGWHFFQQRISALWDDVKPTLDGTRTPEPLFFRANSRDCIEFQLVNLIPGFYEMDDFEVRTPTDITGQHIHLVKFDVTASDGAANGFNYEDGSFSPDDVIERIEAINKFGGLLQSDGSRILLEPEPHPFFGVKGAQTTVQRWFADDVRNNAGVDRTLRTVFTHDHFGPSTHQQAGLYAGLVVEPQGSVWRDPDPATGPATFGGRFDGGPTSWRADIVTPDPSQSYREFLLAFADFQLAYEPNTSFPDPAKVINPPAKEEVGLPLLLQPPVQCPGGVAPPCPEAVSADDVGTMVINYRNEPLALRVRDPLSNLQASGFAGDLSFAYRSDITRADPALNVQPTFYPPLTAGMQPGDPFTPLLEAYEGDRVQVRVLVGAHEEGHNFSVNGVKWLFEPSWEDSGYRNSQMMGISEHFEFIIPAVPQTATGDSADFLYTAGRATDDLWNGLWGIMRAYKGAQPGGNGPNALPSNTDLRAPEPTDTIGLWNMCPNEAPGRFYNISAIRADVALPNNTLTYNSRTNQGGTLHDPTAIIYVHDSDLLPNGTLNPAVTVEPLVLRANAGDCIAVTLTNRLPSTPIDLAGFNTLPMIVREFNNNNIWPSTHVGLHPQLVYYDVTTSDGQNVGFNPTQTAAPGASVYYEWYAGGLEPDSSGVLQWVPREFGASNLMSSDPIKHAHKGAFGALIIEPANATWSPANANSVVVTTGSTQFYEHVVQFQTDVNLRFGGNGAAVPLIAETEDPEDSGHKAVNYRTEPMWKRFNFAPNTQLSTTRTFDFSTAFANSQVGGDPQTPVFVTPKGAATRFRILTAGGHARNNVFALHGHAWQELPYTNGSVTLGNNVKSEWTGSFMGLGASSHFDALLRNGAGGAFQIPGDYLFRAQPSFLLDGGLWGIFRVTP
ncbi:MAG TPA: copper oxidase, partial [Thermoanaerobaculia bacterium]